MHQQANTYSNQCRELTICVGEVLDKYSGKNSFLSHQSNIYWHHDLYELQQAQYNIYTPDT